jgi:protocatechuate 3,4-dioxygenase beta subunit
VKSVATVVIAIILLCFARPGFGAQLVGKLSDSQGTPVANMRVAISHADGSPARVLITDDRGKFEAGGLNPGDYKLILHPVTGGSLGAPLLLHLSPKGIRLQLRVVSNVHSMASNDARQVPARFPG